jgi:diacylglycerol kinase (ATP)
VKKILDSFKYAGRGIRTVFAEERNMRIHGVITLLVIVLGFYYHITSGEWIAILLCIGLVFVLEIINTAFEILVDLIQPHHDPIAGKIKDIAAGAVLVGAMTAAITGMIIFAKYIL